MAHAHRFRVRRGRRLDLGKLDPKDTGGERKQRALLEQVELGQRLRELQALLWAEGKQSLLVVLQALDAGGKDGTIRHVFGAMNPQGTRVHGFTVPTHLEAAHDFLWRVHAETPARGEVVVFNRSHYEDVLVARVRKLVPRAVWSKRYRMIRDFERVLSESGTRVLKFFLHISKEEQLARFKKRLDDPARRFKISLSDYSERERWPEYIDAYEDALSKTSMDEAPWYVIPADHKWYRDLVISRIVVEELVAMRMRYPAPKVDLAEVRRRFHKASR